MNQETMGNNEAQPPSASPESRKSPPVRPRELEDDFEEGVLFSDPELTAWWWNTHEFMTVSERLEMCIKVQKLCSSRSCTAMFFSVREELEQFTAPVSTWDSFTSNMRIFVRERPYFAAITVLAVMWLLLSAGGSLYSLATRIASS